MTNLFVSDDQHDKSIFKTNRVRIIFSWLGWRAMSCSFLIDSIYSSSISRKSATVATNIPPKIAILTIKLLFPFNLRRILKLEKIIANHINDIKAA